TKYGLVLLAAALIMIGFKLILKEITHLF
ncbi:MAG: hypothetical protein ACI9K4_000911, partial [Polaribacter sp.]